MGDWFVRLSEVGDDDKSFFGKPAPDNGAWEKHIWGRDWKIVFAADRGRGERHTMISGRGITKAAARRGAARAFDRMPDVV